MVERIRKKRVKYTRYVDDITVSHKSRKYDFLYVKKVIEDMLVEKDLPINSDKTEISTFSSKPTLVHGLRITEKMLDCLYLR